MSNFSQVLYAVLFFCVSVVSLASYTYGLDMGPLEPLSQEDVQINKHVNKVLTFVRNHPELNKELIVSRIDKILSRDTTTDHAKKFLHRLKTFIRPIGANIRVYEENGKFFGSVKYRRPPITQEWRFENSFSDPMEYPISTDAKFSLIGHLDEDGNYVGIKDRSSLSTEFTSIIDWIEISCLEYHENPDGTKGTYMDQCPTEYQKDIATNQSSDIGHYYAIMFNDKEEIIYIQEPYSP